MKQKHKNYNIKLLLLNNIKIFNTNYKLTSILEAIHIKSKQPTKTDVFWTGILKCIEILRIHNMSWSHNTKETSKHKKITPCSPDNKDSNYHTDFNFNWISFLIMTKANQKLWNIRPNTNCREFQLHLQH